MPCQECGASVDRSSPEQHRCDLDRRLDYLLFSLREEVSLLEPQWARYLESPGGRFEAWVAARQVRRGC